MYAKCKPGKHLQQLPDVGLPGTKALLKHWGSIVAVSISPGCPCFAVQCVMREFPEARMAYGESDEYSFVLHKDTQLYGKWLAAACACCTNH